MKFMAAEAASAAATQQQEDPRAATIRMVGMLLVMGLLFYFMLIRPQSKRAKQQAEMLKTIKPGDKVATSSGIIGTVIAVKDKSVSIRSADSKLEISKSAISEVSERGGDSAPAAT